MAAPLRHSTLARSFVAVLLAGLLVSAALAEDAPPAKTPESGFVGWFRDVGRAIGMAFRDIGMEGKRIGLAIGHGAASFGKEVGQGAKEGGKAFGRAITGKDAPSSDAGKDSDKNAKDAKETDKDSSKAPAKEGHIPSA